jgi:hypothetical protein
MDARDPPTVLVQIGHVNTHVRTPALGAHARHRDSLRDVVVVEYLLPDPAATDENPQQVNP